MNTAPDPPEPNISSASACDKSDSRPGFRRKANAARLSVGCNALLVLLKLAVGLWTGSVGVLSEAMHSATDLLAASIAYLSVRVSDTPPDEDHPYGHGKIESISGLAEALLILLAAALILFEAIQKLRSPGENIPSVGAGWRLWRFQWLSTYLYPVI